MTISIGSKLDKNLKLIYDYNWLFIKLFQFWSFKFFAPSQISSAKYLEISKLTRMRRLVDKFRNSGTKITASGTYFLQKNQHFFCKEISWFPICVFDPKIRN